LYLNLLSAKVKVTLCQRTLPSGFAASYHFSISPTCRFASEMQSILHIRHLKG